MRLLTRKIIVNNSISRFCGTIPATVKIWKTPIGDFTSRKEAELAVAKTSYQLDSITMDFTYGDIDIADNGLGNYGLIPFNITESAITGNESSNTVPYSKIIEWYGFLTRYNEKIGNDETAEKHYLLETNGENVSPQHLQEAIDEDNKVNELREYFNTNDPAKWIEKNLLGKEQTTKTVKGIISNSDDVFSRGFFTLPIMLTSNVDDTGQMSIIEDTFNVNEFFESGLTYDFRLGEIYNDSYFINEQGKVDYLDSAYIIYKLKNPEDSSLVVLSGNTNTSYPLTDKYVGLTTYEGKEYEAYATKYYDWCLKWNTMYDVSKSEMENPSSNIDINRSIKNIAYDVYGNLVPYDDTLSHQWYIVKTYNLEKPSEYGFFVIKGNMYEVKHDLFVKYKDPSCPQFNNKLFPVYEVKKHNVSDTLLYYTIINGKKYIADMRYANGSNKKLPCFYFKDPNACHKSEAKYSVVTSTDSREKKYYIEYEGGYVFLDANDSTITLDEINILSDSDEVTDIEIYRRLSYYVDIDGLRYYIPYDNQSTLDNEITLYVQGDNIITYNNTAYTITQNFVKKMPEGGQYPDLDFTNLLFTLTYENVRYPASILSGYTLSRMYMVRDLETTTDSLGNQMPGTFEFEYDSAIESARTFGSNDKRVNSKYNEPYDGILLEIPFHIGTTNEIEYVDDYIKGDILSELLIIPYDSDGEEIFPAIKNKFYADENINIDDVYNRKLSEMVESFFKDYKAITVKLKVKYQIGAELNTKIIYDDSTPPQAWIKLYYPKTDETLLNGGIVYTEEFTLIEKKCKYNTTENKSITLRYYDLESDIHREYVNNDFEDTVQSEQQAIFSFAVNGYGNNRNTNRWNNMNAGKNRYGEYKYDPLNNSMLSPVIAKDCLFGVSMPQNINNNIYIDRGIHSFFEKQMKLNEAKTLDALMLYGNKWFKIDS